MEADPNGFATGALAATALALVAVEQDDVAAARRHEQQARDALSAADRLVRETGAAYEHSVGARCVAAAQAISATELLQAAMDRLAAARAPLHPVRKTPRDVLVVIFAYCVDDLRHLSAVREMCEWDTALRQRQLQPFWLARVCRLWRTAALSQPRIWSLFELHAGINKRRSVQKWMGYLDMLDARCGAVPVHIGLYRAGRPGLHDSELTSKIACLLDRCRTMCVFQPEFVESDPTLLVLQRNTPRLERLDMQVTHVHSSISLLLPHVPVLRVLTGSYPFADTLFDFSSLVAADLQSICCSAIQDDLSALLGAAPILRELRATDIYTGGISLGPPAVSGVTRLRLTFDDPNNSPLALARRVEFPSLGMCELDGTPAASKHRLEYLIALATGSQSLVRVVVGNLNRHGLRQLADNLHVFRAVRDLEIWGARFSRASFTHLCASLQGRDDAGRFVCPALVILRLPACSFHKECDQEALVRCVRKRLLAAKELHRDSAPARLLHVKMCRNMNPAVVAAVKQALKDEDKVRRSVIYPRRTDSVLEVRPSVVS